MDRIEYFQATPRHWKKLVTTLTHLVKLGLLCQNIQNDLFNKLFDTLTDDVRRLLRNVELVIDFDESFRNNRFCTNNGIDDYVDALKRSHAGLDDYLGQIAYFQLETLPDFIDECLLVYIPQVGFLLSIAEDLVALNSDPSGMSSDKTPSLRQIDGLELMFRIPNEVYYKSDFCSQLDVGIGDVLVSIVLYI
jgi:DNA mismatch repair protein MSH5